MAKIKEVTISKSFKKGLPNYGSVWASYSITLEGEPTDKEIKEAQETCHRESEKECDVDPIWLRKAREKEEK